MYLFGELIIVLTDLPPPYFPSVWWQYLGYRCTLTLCNTTRIYKYIYADMHSNKLKAKVFIDNFRRLTDSLWPTRCSHCISILSHTIVSSIMLEPKQVTFWKIPRMASKMCMKLTLTDLKPYLSIIYKSDVFQSWLGFSPSGNPLGHQIRSVNECSKIIARLSSNEQSRWACIYYIKWVKPAHVQFWMSHNSHTAYLHPLFVVTPQIIQVTVLLKLSLMNHIKQPLIFKMVNSFLTEL